MKRTILALVLSLLSGPVWAQGAVRQNGSITPGDVSVFIQDRVVESAGKYATDTGKGVNPFNIFDNLGIGLCSNSAVTTGTYHSLCLGHNSSGDPIFTVDGTSYPFLGSGTGNIVGPSPVSVGDIAVFNSTLGTLLKVSPPALMTDAITAGVTADYATMTLRTVAGLSADTILSEVRAAGPNFDGIRSLVSLPISSTTATSNALAGYIVNNVPAVGGLRNTVALFGVADNAVNSAHSWGFNVVGGDKTAALTSTLFQNEIDFNGQNASSIWTGLAFSGATTVQPASAVGVICESFGTGMLYNAGCINSADGVAVTGIMLGGGTGAPGAAAFSQKIQQTAYTGAGAPVNGTIYLDNGKNYNMDAPATGTILLRIGTVPVLEAITSTPSAGNTGMSVIYNGNAGIAVGQVAVGAVDSCTAGFRCLRVSN